MCWLMLASGMARGSTLLYDFDPNTLAGVAGSSVATLTDSIGGTIAFAQTTGTNQPTISTSLFGGLKTLHSTGNMWMSTGTFTALPTGSTVFMVWQQIENGSWKYPCSFFTAAGNEGGILTDNVAFWSRDATTPYGYHVSGTTQTYLLELVENGSSSEMRVNGTLAYTGMITGYTAVTRLGFFSDNTATQNFGMSGDFARMQVYSAITSAERATVRSSLASIYSVTLDTVTDVRFAATNGTLATNGNAYRILASTNYASGTPAIVGVICHGSSGSVKDMYANIGGGVVEDAILAQGGIMAGLSLSNTYTQAGLLSDIVATEELIAFIITNYNVKCIVMFGESRGGASSNLVLARNTSGKVKGWYGICPVQDGVNWYSTSDTTLNPLTRSISDYAGKWMMWNASAGDTAVLKTSNSDIMYARLAGSCAERINVVCAGPHGDVSHYGYNRTVAFIKRVAGITQEYNVSGPANGTYNAASTTFTLSLANATVTDFGNGTTPTISSSLTFDGSYGLTLTASAGNITATAAGGTITGNSSRVVNVIPANGQSSFTYIYSPGSGGTKSLLHTNGQGWANITSLFYNALNGLFRRSSGTRVGGRGSQ